MGRISLMCWVLFSFGASSCVGSGFVVFEGDIMTEEFRPALDAVVYAWGEVLGPVAPSCVDALSGIPVYVVDSIPKICSYAYPEVDILACNVISVGGPGDDWDAVAAVLSYRSTGGRQLSMVHEYIHLLQWCTDKATDPFHGNPLLWSGIDGDTVESVACSLIPSSL